MKGEKNEAEYFLYFIVDSCLFLLVGCNDTGDEKETDADVDAEESVTVAVNEE